MDGLKFTLPWPRSESIVDVVVLYTIVKSSQVKSSHCQIVSSAIATNLFFSFAHPPWLIRASTSELASSSQTVCSTGSRWFFYFASVHADVSRLSTSSTPTRRTFLAMISVTSLLACTRLLIPQPFSCTAFALALVVASPLASPSSTTPLLRPRRPSPSTASPA